MSMTLETVIVHKMAIRTPTMIKSYSESDTFGLRPYPDRIEEEQDGEYPPQSDPGGLRLSTGSKGKMKRRRYASRRAVSLQDTPMYLVEQYNFATVQVIEEKKGKAKKRGGIL